MNKIYSVLEFINKFLQKLEIFFGSLSLGVLFVVMIVNAALRYIFKSGLNWSDELNGFLFVWMGLLAAANAMARNVHLNITALVNVMPKTVQIVLRTIMNIIMIVMFILYMPGLSKLLKTLPISNVMRIPLKYVYVILPLAFGLMCYHILFNIITDWVSYLKEKHEGKEVSA